MLAGNQIRVLRPPGSRQLALEGVFEEALAQGFGFAQAGGDALFQLFAD